MPRSPNWPRICSSFGKRPSATQRSTTHRKERIMKRNIMKVLHVAICSSTLALGGVAVAQTNTGTGAPTGSGSSNTTGSGTGIGGTDSLNHRLPADSAGSDRMGTGSAGTDSTRSSTGTGASTGNPANTGSDSVPSVQRTGRQRDTTTTPRGAESTPGYGSGATDPTGTFDPTKSHNDSPGTGSTGSGSPTPTPGSTGSSPGGTQGSGL